MHAESSSFSNSPMSNGASSYHGHLNGNNGFHTRAGDEAALYLAEASSLNDLHTNGSLLRPQQGPEYVIEKRGGLDPVSLTTKHIWFGSYRTLPHKDGVCFQEEFLTLTVKDDPALHSQVLPRYTPDYKLLPSRPFAFKIGWHNLQKIDYRCEGAEAIILVTVTSACAQKICATFELPETYKNEAQLPYFDPESVHPSHRLLTVRFETPSYDWEYSLRLLLMRISATGVRPPSFRKISLEEARSIFTLLPNTGTALLQSEVVSGEPKLAYDPFQKPPPPVNIPLPIRPNQRLPLSSSLSPHLRQLLPLVQTLAYRHADPSVPSNFQVQATISVPHRSTLLTVEQALEQITSSNSGTPSSGGGAGGSETPPTEGGEKPLGKTVLVSTQKVLNLCTSRRLMEIMSPICKKMKTDGTEGSSTGSGQPSGYNTRTGTPTTFGNTPVYPVDYRLVYPIPTPTNPSTKDSITVTAIDMGSLEPDQFLNDTIIDFYLKFVWHEMVSPAMRRRVYIFNSFFYSRLTSKATSFNSVAAAAHAASEAAAAAAVASASSATKASGGETAASSSDAAATAAAAAVQLTRDAKAAARHRLVRTWTKNVDIFDMDFIVVPINENAHWYLAIICFPGVKVTSETRKLIETSVEAAKKKVLSEFETEAGDDEANVNTAKSGAESTSSAATTADSNAATVASPLKSLTPLDAIDDEYLDEAKEMEFQTKLADEQSNDESLPSRNMEQHRKVPCIIIMDSLLAGSPRYQTVGILRDYLAQEYRAKRPNTERPIFDKTTCRGVYPKVPQQDNFSDCGLYVLQYAESFLTRPPLDFAGAQLPRVLRNVCDVDSCRFKRSEIRNLLLKLRSNSLAAAAASAANNA